MKNIIKKHLFLPLLALFILSSVSPFFTIPLHAKAEPEFSEDDIKFLEEAQKEVAKYVDNLPTEAALRAQGMTPEQIAAADTKEKFQREVERLSKMSEEELLQEIEKAIDEVSRAQTPEAQTELPPINIVQEETKPAEPAKPTVSSNKQIAAIQLIDALIMSIDNFLRKAQIMVELPSKITNWSKDGKLRGWPAGQTWNAFRNQAEDFLAKLQKMKDRDPRSNNYKYLDDFIADETLQNNLTKAKDSLTKLEPQIELSPFGIDKMTSQARQATRSFLLNLHEAISILAIPTALDKIFEKYEPTAKKIKESQEAAQKRAFEESRQARAAQRVTITGKPRGADDFGRPFDFDRGRGGFTPEHFDAPRRDTEEKKPSSGLPKATDAKAGAAGGDAKKAADTGKAAEKQKYETDKKAERFETAFIDAMETIKGTLSEFSELQNIEKHVFKETKEPVKEDLPEAIKAVTSATRKAKSQATQMKSHLKVLNENQKKNYRKNMKDAYKDVKTEFEKLTAQINNIIRPERANLFSRLKEDEQITFKTKLYSYNKQEYSQDLKDTIKKEKDKAAKAGTAVPLHIEKADAIITKGAHANIEGLKKDIQDLKKAMDELG